jgi:4a-hydroxytetrahydrobiopterin dehydratase
MLEDRGMTDILDEGALDRWMEKIPGWEMEEACLGRVFEFEGYLDGIEFVNRVAEVAEEVDHYPDMDVRYGWVEVTLTGDEGGLTEKDFLVAQRIDSLV